MTNSNAGAAPARKGFSGLQVLGITVLAVVVTIVATVWIARVYLFPAQFKPVTLSQKESQRLDGKLARLEQATGIGGAGLSDSNEPLQPEAYSEAGASRDIGFTEKELNALIARNTNLASRLAIDLSDNLASAKLLVPMEEDFPFVGGRTLRVSAGMELSYTNSRPVVVLKGVSVMGVPIPNAWLGNLKNVDLVNEFGGDRGFWKAFADGVELIAVRDGELHLKLKE